jgi:hypothetical protein
MSTSLASAKKRRANITEPQPQFRQQPQMQQQPGGGLTLQQVIKLVDTRLTTLEKIVSDQKNGVEEGEESGDWIDEFNKRTEIIAVEIDSIKTTVLQLQAFTMEVNKKMFEKIEALTAKQPVSFAREVPSTVATVAAAPAPLPAPVVAPVVDPVVAPVSEVAPTPAITLDITASTPVEAPAPVIEPSNVPILSRFENKSKKNNNTPAST